MTDILRREHAPIGARAWREIDEEARDVLATNLAARRFMDVDGPHGFGYSAYEVGRLDSGVGAELEGVQWAPRRVQPLIEARTPFSLSLRELDNIDRGADDLELDAVRAAARKAARFEERALYSGFSAGGITGLAGSSDHAPLSIDDEAQSQLDVVSQGLMVLRDAGVEGPYRLVLGPGPWKILARETSAYPIRMQVAKLLDAEPIYAPHLEGGFLLSTRGEDFELVLGQDFSIGFDSREGDALHLYLLETFTVRFPGGEAVIELRHGSS